MNSSNQNESGNHITSKNRPRIAGSAGKKIKYSLYISGFVLHLSLWLKIISFFSLVLFSTGIHKRREKILALKKIKGI